MSRMRATIFLCAVLIVGLASTALAFRDSGQVVNYAGFKYVTAIATSAQRTYVTTSQGIIVFYKTENRWGTPLTGMDGIDDDMVIQVVQDGYLCQQKVIRPAIVLVNKKKKED